MAITYFTAETFSDVLELEKQMILHEEFHFQLPSKEYLQKMARKAFKGDRQLLDMAHTNILFVFRENGW